MERTRATGLPAALVLCPNVVYISLRHPFSKTICRECLPGAVCTIRHCSSGAESGKMRIVIPESVVSTMRPSGEAATCRMAWGQCRMNGLQRGIRHGAFLRRQRVKGEIIGIGERVMIAGSRGRLIEQF